MNPQPILRPSALSDRHLRSLLEEAVHGAATDSAPARCVGPRRAGVHGQAFHRAAVGGLRPAPQASIERSLKGLEQQMRALFWAISRGLMPPLCCMSTVPERMVVLQVPHMP